MAAKTVLGGIAVTALVGGTLVAGAPAHADDSKVRTGDCTRTATYRMALADLDRDDQDRLRAVFAVNGPRANARWSVTFKRNGQVVHRAAKRANDRGNVTFASTFRGDDDAWVKVIARSGYGERCARRLTLDD
jgi:predicted ATPase